MRFLCEKSSIVTRWAVYKQDPKLGKVMVAEYTTEDAARTLQTMLNEATEDEQNRVIRLIALMAFSAYNS